MVLNFGQCRVADASATAAPDATIRDYQQLGIAPHLKREAADAQEIAMLQDGIQTLDFGATRLIDVDMAPGPLETSIEPLLEASRKHARPATTSSTAPPPSVELDERLQRLRRRARVARDVVLEQLRLHRLDGEVHLEQRAADGEACAHGTGRCECCSGLEARAEGEGGRRDGDHAEMVRW